MKEQNEKQAIEELTAFLWKNTLIHTEDLCHDVAETVIKEGYRKQRVVIDEFAKRLKEKMNDLSRMEYNCVSYFLVSKSFIDKIAEEMKGGEE